MFGWLKKILADPGVTERNELACYHAKKRKDCPFYQRGSCSCSYQKGQTIGGISAPAHLIDK